MEMPLVLLLGSPLDYSLVLELASSMGRLLDWPLGSPLVLHLELRSDFLLEFWLVFELESSMAKRLDLHLVSQLDNLLDLVSASSMVKQLDF